jgi:hypothetical protein
MTQVLLFYHHASCLRPSPSKARIPFQMPWCVNTSPPLSTPGPCHCSHLQGFLAYHNTLPNQATPPRSPIIPQGPLSPPCPCPCPCPCPHGSHNPSALPINPLFSTIYPHSILPWLIHEPHHSLGLASQASASALPSLLCPCPFTYRRQTPSPGVICVGHGMGVKIGVHNIAFLAILQWSQFSTFKKDA